MISLAFGYVCDVCVSDVRRACCVSLYFGIVVENRMETRNERGERGATKVATTVLVDSVRVVCEF